MWKTINQLTNKKSKTTSINELIINEEIVTEPEKIADSFNTYFNAIIHLKRMSSLPINNLKLIDFHQLMSKT